MALYRRVASKTSFHGTISHRMYQLSPKVITRRHPSRRPFRWRVRRLNPPQSTQPAGFVRLSFGGMVWKQAAPQRERPWARNLLPQADEETRRGNCDARRRCGRRAGGCGARGAAGPRALQSEPVSAAGALCALRRHCQCRSLRHRAGARRSAGGGAPARLRGRLRPVHQTRRGRRRRSRLWRRPACRHQRRQHRRHRRR